MLYLLIYLTVSCSPLNHCVIEHNILAAYVAKEDCESDALYVRDSIAYAKDHGFTEKTPGVITCSAYTAI